MQMEGENGGGLGTRLGIIMENSRNMGNGGFLQPDQHDNGMAATIKMVKKVLQRNITGLQCTEMHKGSVALCWLKMG